MISYAMKVPLTIRPCLGLTKCGLIASVTELHGN